MLVTTDSFMQKYQVDSSSVKKLLSVRDLTVSSSLKSDPMSAVRNISFDLHQGEIFGIVGESGSGKSMACKAIMGLLPDGMCASGSVVYNDEVNLLTLSQKKMSNYRGKALSMIFQDPQSCLNPIKTIFSHLKEVSLRDGLKTNLRQKAQEQLEQVHIPNARGRLDAYPFEFSGGMAQRVQIAMALSGNPKILIADEPTTALDVTIQAKIMDELKALRDSRGLSVILVTHDLGLVAEICDRIAVMYHGHIVETGKTQEVLSSPHHPYTQALLASVPSIDSKDRSFTAIKGECMSSHREVKGCDFAERCPHAQAQCHMEKPQYTSLGNRVFSCFLWDKLSINAKIENKTEKLRPDLGQEVLAVNNLVCSFKIRNNEGLPVELKAVNDVSFNINEREIFGVVGESGSGKSTLAKAVMGLIKPSGGDIDYLQKSVHRGEWAFKDYAREVQYIFQDPFGALDPMWSILDQVMEALLIRGVRSKSERRERSEAMLIRCGLDSSFFKRRPQRLSGGQQQRAVIARALVGEPKLLICDEPVSAMDVSVQAQILNLLKELAYEKKVSMLFISHNLSIVKNICDRCAVMQAGKIVELGDTQTLFNNPKHAYTQELIASIPVLRAKTIQFEGDSHEQRACVS